MVALTLFRQFILAMRHGCTNRFTYNEWFGKNARYTEHNETLLMYTWVELSPKFIMRELE